MVARALSFGVVAEAYERFRPVYPVELLDLVMSYVMLPPADRDQVFRRTLQVLPETVEINAEITAHLARRHH
jgi:hypothetical protein